MPIITIANGYRLTLKHGAYVITDDSKRIVRLIDTSRDYRRMPSDTWYIVGIGRRHNSRDLVSLSAAADGADIGQGWVHDIDHGTHRMWTMPKHQRVMKVERIANYRVEV